MTIQTEFDRIRQVRADLEERGTPVAVVEIEVIVVDGNRLARELETHLGAWPRLFVRFERTHFLLSDAQDHDAFTAREACPIFRHDRVFVLARFEGHDRNLVLGRELVHAVTNRSCIGLNNAGDGMGWPR